MVKDNYLKNILGLFELPKNSAEYTIREFGTGLIHKTYLIECEGRPEYILQKINQQISEICQN